MTTNKMAIENHRSGVESTKDFSLIMRFKPSKTTRFGLCNLGDDKESMGKGKEHKFVKQFLNFDVIFHFELFEQISPTREH